MHHISFVAKNNFKKNEVLETEKKSSNRTQLKSRRREVGGWGLLIELSMSLLVWVFLGFQFLCFYSFVPLRSVPAGGGDVER